MKIQWFGIKTPDKVEKDGYVHWISNSEFDSWHSFFSRTTRGEEAYHVLPLEEAIKAYEAIGYRCVELEVRIKKDINWEVFVKDFVSLSTLSLESNLIPEQQKFQKKQKKN